MSSSPTLLAWFLIDLPWNQSCGVNAHVSDHVAVDDNGGDNAHVNDHVNAKSVYSALHSDRSENRQGAGAANRFLFHKEIRRSDFLGFGRSQKQATGNRQPATGNEEG